jgi:hypothetical protein
MPIPMPVATATPERRRAPRTTLEKIAYIHIEPDNGGIVLNASAEGLAFHSMAAVEANGMFRFSLLDQNRRLDACGELTWIDDEHKSGGVRFTTLTEDARLQIENWIREAGVEVEERPASTLGKAILKAFPSFRFPRATVRRERGEISPVMASFLRREHKLRLTGFAGGLAAGLLVSAVCACAFLVYGHRSDIGKALIHWGERLAAEPGENRQPPAPAIAVKPAPAAVASAAATPRTAESKKIRRSEPVMVARTVAKTKDVKVGAAATPAKSSLRVSAEPLTSSGPRKGAVAGPAASAAATNAASGAATGNPEKGALSSAAVSSVAGTSAAVTANVAAGNPVAADVATPSATRSASTAVVSNVDEHPVSKMYFEVGKFKDEFLAHDLSERVSHLGYKASVTRKGHLWANSFHVLVGPYGTEDDATTTEKNLVSGGFKPLPFERGSRGFNFGSSMSLAGGKVPAGECSISWESYVSDARVKFSQGGSLLAGATARWEKRPARFRQNEYVYIRRGDGSRLLLEVHFSGLDRALVFRDPS